MKQLIAIVSTAVCIEFISSQVNVITNQAIYTERGACISNPCLHDGICTTIPSGFICTCLNGFIGVQCERRADDCPYDNKMDCINGICKLDLNGQPHCICNEGFEGPACSIVTDNCALNPCHNDAKCIDKISGYDCKCKPGSFGTHCQFKDTDINTCLNTCQGYLQDGKCWHDKVENVTVGWGYGDFLCNSMQTCFNTTSKIDVYNDDFDFMEVQLKPIHMQSTDNLIFITDRDAILYDYNFIPHILPMEADSKESFITCNISNAIPLTAETNISELNVNSSLLHIGTQYFIAEVNSLHRCNFGLRLNVTVKDKDCVDPFDSSTGQCNGHGKCFSDFSRSLFECLCCHGFMGDYCQYEDPCYVNPCANDGICEVVDFGSGVLKHQCQCKNGYHGNRCQKFVDHCSSNPCYNNAACYSKLNGFTCACPVGYSGERCEVNLDECRPNPCKNDGICHDGLNKFKCQCPPGFSGILCEVDIDECHSSPCVSGTCLDHVNNYTCACPPGISGRHCETRLNECESQPCVNGRCVVEKDGFSCSCGIGYTGLLCEIKLNLCLHSQYCITEHAQSCVDLGDSVKCQCIEGWSGDNCAVNTDECNLKKCENHALCIDKLNAFECVCPQGYSGDLCEVSPPKLIPDIEIKFMAADNCARFMTPQGIQNLEENIFPIVSKACECVFDLPSINPGSSRVTCDDDMAGTFTADLKHDDVTFQKKLVCGMQNYIRTQQTPNIYHKTYLVGIVDNSKLCDPPHPNTTDERIVKMAESDVSSTGIIIGVLVGLLILVIAIVFLSTKLRNSRNTKIGIAHKFEKETIAFDNAAYVKEVGDDNTPFDEEIETAFSSDCPKWAEGYDRARTLYERNRAAPAGRLFDSTNPGGEKTQI